MHCAVLLQHGTAGCLSRTSWGIPLSRIGIVAPDAHTQGHDALGARLADLTVFRIALRFAPSGADSWIFTALQE